MSHIVHEPTNKKICGANVHGTFMVTGENMFRKNASGVKRLLKKKV